MNQLKSIDLFAGIGGIRLGFARFSQGLSFPEDSYGKRI